jgi:hypothetical protein
MQEKDYAWMPSIEILRNINENDTTKETPDIIKRVFQKRINVEEINNIFSVIVNMEEIADGVKLYHKYPMKLCDHKDFQDFDLHDVDLG